MVVDAVKLVICSNCTRLYLANGTEPDADYAGPLPWTGEYGIVPSTWDGIEPSMSKVTCDTCGDSKAGYRFDAVGYPNV